MREEENDCWNFPDLDEWIDWDEIEKTFEELEAFMDEFFNSEEWREIEERMDELIEELKCGD